MGVVNVQYRATATFIAETTIAVFNIDRAVSARSLCIEHANQAAAINIDRVVATMPDGRIPESWPALLPKGSTVRIYVRRIDRRFKRPILLTLETVSMEGLDRGGRLRITSFQA